MSGLLPPKWVSNAADRPAIHMTGISDFVQQSHNFITPVVKLPQGMKGGMIIRHLGRTPMNG
jgi:hypothetical protein